MESRLGKPKVLVVDDEALIADTVAAILNGNGFEAAAAYSAEQAIALAERLHPDVLLSDVLMPTTTGVDLAISITKIFPNTRICLFSGQASTVDLMRKAESLGYHFELLPKPIHPDELLARLKKV
jgi:DNA-binding response OmpR family regulator